MKFIAKYAAIAGIRKNQDRISTRFCHNPSVPVLTTTKTIAAMSPKENPFSEKVRPGSHGSNRGVRTAPVVRATSRDNTAKRPSFDALDQNPPVPPKPPIKKNTGKSQQSPFESADQFDRDQNHPFPSREGFSSHLWCGF